MSEQGETYERAQKKQKAIRRLWYAGGLLVLYLIMYAITGGGPTGLLFGAIMGFVSLAILIFLVMGIYGLIRYR